MVTIYLVDKFRALAAGRHDGFELVDKGGPKLGLSRGGRTRWVPRRLVQFPNGELNPARRQRAGGPARRQRAGGHEGHEEHEGGKEDTE